MLLISNKCINFIFLKLSISSRKKQEEYVNYVEFKEHFRVKTSIGVLLGGKETKTTRVKILLS